MDQSHQITKLLRDWSDGSREALDALLPLVYAELHKQAARQLRNERPGHTLQTTALIHEAYLKLIGHAEIEWQSRTQIFAFASKVMRHILVDHARSKQREKRGGGGMKVPLEDAMTAAINAQDIDLVALNDALDRLAKIDEQQGRVVELRYFGGLSLEDTAAALKISRSTAARDWNVARSWLHRELTR